MKDGVALTLDFSNVMPSGFVHDAGHAVAVPGHRGRHGRVGQGEIAGRSAQSNHHPAFLVTLALYIVVSLLPLGVYSQAEVGSMADPSMAAHAEVVPENGRDHGERRRDRLGAELLARLMLMLGEMPLAASKAASSQKCS